MENDIARIEEATKKPLSRDKQSTILPKSPILAATSLPIDM
jgi:hypothetical protein